MMKEEGHTMGAIRGTYIDGKVVLDRPVKWVEGTEVWIELVDPPYGCLPEDDDNSSEAIARRLALMDRMEPVGMTEEDIAAWEKVRAEDKAWFIAHLDEYHAKIDKLFP